MTSRDERWTRSQLAAGYRLITLLTGLLSCPVLALGAQRLPRPSPQENSTSLLLSACDPMPPLPLAATAMGPLTCSHTAPVSPTATPAPSAGRVGKGAAMGALLGATAGTITAYIITHRPSVTDHSEDGMVYFIYVPAGALLGLLVGLSVVAASAP